MITVEQLIDRLQRLPGDLRVVVQGYEGGYDDAEAPREIYVNLDANRNTANFGSHLEARGGGGTRVILVE